MQVLSDPVTVSGEQGRQMAIVPGRGMRRRRRCDDPKPGNLLKNVALPPSKAWPTESAPGPRARRVVFGAPAFFGKQAFYHIRPAMYGAGKEYPL